MFSCDMNNHVTFLQQVIESLTHSSGAGVCEAQPSPPPRSLS